MCDNDSFDDMAEYDLKRRGLSRRQFGALTIGAGLMSVLPPVANAAETQESEVEIKTPDGTCDAYFVHPSKGASPAVLVWPDIFGLRPAFRQMGKRLAAEGFVVLVPNPFYRLSRAPVYQDFKFGSEATTARMGEVRPFVTAAGGERDAHAFVAFLQSQKQVKGKIGTDRTVNRHPRRRHPSTRLR